jgi:hypothetical protein
MDLKKFNTHRLVRIPKRQETQRGVSWFIDRVDYDPDAGKFYFKKQGANKRNVPGKEIIPTRTGRYSVEIFLNGIGYQAARVAYICMEQKIPNVVLAKDNDFKNLTYSNLYHVSSDNFTFIKED